MSSGLQACAESLTMNPGAMAVLRQQRIMGHHGVERLLFSSAYPPSILPLAASGHAHSHLKASIGLSLEALKAG